MKDQRQTQTDTWLVAAPPGGRSEWAAAIITAAAEALDATSWEVWRAYLSMGGTRSHGDILRRLRGTDAWSSADFDLASAGLNDEFTQIGQGRPLQSSRDMGGPF